ncbi:MAG: hypothetical protein HRU24_09745 [Gammaproteobacteria bacterium]|nr:hypothetical protein [Gammaproteobacteria bacterium]
MRKRLILAILLCFSINSLAYELDAYAKPVPYYHYVSDLSVLLKKSAERNHWDFSKDNQGNYFSRLLYKSYDINTQLMINNNTVTIKLLSANRVNCSRRCSVDQDVVQGWLLNFRRAIAFDVTLAVKKSALIESLQLKSD